jgi:putative spermidine/putrescine transport system ATP-binding protein
MSVLRATGLTRTFGALRAVDSVDLELSAGELVCLLGPSGCGKSTLLGMLAGHVQPDAGAIWLGERELTHVPPEGRDIGMVFQSYALFPHLSAARNISFGLEVRGVARAEIAARVERALALVGLDAQQAARKPAQLSGGQQQRVALARALILNPALLLLDEPFANLDARLREDLRAELRRIQRETNLPTLLVTHDQGEALTLADRIAVMLGGRIVQLDAPAVLYTRPASREIARFVGDANILEVFDRSEHSASCALGTIAVEGAGDAALIRPEDMILCRDDESTFAMTIHHISFHGADRIIEGEVGGVTLRARQRALEAEVSVGARAPMRLRGAAWLLP